MGSPSAVGNSSAGGAATGGPRVNCVPHRGQLRTTPCGTCAGLNWYGQLGFGHFSVFTTERLVSEAVSPHLTAQGRSSLGLRLYLTPPLYPVRPRAAGPSLLWERTRVG